VRFPSRVGDDVEVLTKTRQAKACSFAYGFPFVGPCSSVRLMTEERSGSLEVTLQRPAGRFLPAHGRTLTGRPASRARATPRRRIRIAGRIAMSQVTASRRVRFVHVFHFADLAVHRVLAVPPWSGRTNNLNRPTV
jgi:hypothetical protein